MTDHSISIVLPAFNEAESLPIAVDRAVEAMGELVSDFEVIVVDDGSTDETLVIARELMSKHQPHVRLAAHPVNRGYGAALRTGFALARCDLTFYTDADNQFDPSDLKHFLPLIDEYDLIVGLSRLPLRHGPALVSRPGATTGSSASCSGSGSVTSIARSSSSGARCSRRSRSSATTSSSIRSSSPSRAAGTSGCSRRASAITRGSPERRPCAPRTWWRRSGRSRSCGSRIYFPGRRHLARMAQDRREGRAARDRARSRFSGRLRHGGALLRGVRADPGRALVVHRPGAGSSARCWRAGCPLAVTTAVRILDVGCGTGTNLAELGRFGRVEGRPTRSRRQLNSAEAVAGRWAYPRGRRCRSRRPRSTSSRCST